MERELPEGWVEVELGEIIKVSSGDGLTSKNMNEEGGIPVFGGNGINGYHDKSNVSEETIVIGRVGYYCGSVHLTPDVAWVTDNALKVSFSKENLYTLFLYRLLTATDLRQNTSSTAQPVISGTKIYPTKVSLPPLAEQKRIVAKLDEAFKHLDILKARLERIPELLKNFRQAILTQAVTGKLTKDWAENLSLPNWAVSQVGSFMQEVRGKVDPTGATESHYIGLEHIEKDGKLLGFGSSSELKSIKTVFRKGDVLYGKLRPYLNKHVIAPFDGVCSTDIIVYRNSEDASSKFFNYFLGMPKTVVKATADSKGINLPRVSAKEINTYTITVPPLEEQKEIVKRVEALFAKAEAVEGCYTSLKQKIDKLPQALLAKAFRGELVPQNPSDESASELLEKIKAAKTAAEKPSKGKKAKGGKQGELVM
jgi:type I restriction enzyme, S subunit